MKQGDSTEVVKHYINRPVYSVFSLEKSIKCINDTNRPLEDLNVVETGVGTGKLTKILVEIFKPNIIAVEPNDNMCEEGIKSTQNCSSISWKKGSGEETGVESGMTDWVVMVSSFHWTDPTKSLLEFVRVLHGGGAFPVQIILPPFGIHAI